MKAIVLLNRAAGAFSAMTGGRGDHFLADALLAVGIEADVRVVASAQLQVEAEAAATAAVDVVIAGGGDGTLSTVAGALVDQRIPLGILPLGTLNHFAKDLAIPLDVAGAARVIAAKHIAKIDVGEVNGRVFINNSSLGIYPHVVLDREAQQRRHGLSKLTAMTIAMMKVLRRFPMVQIRLATDKETVVRKTPLVFVGNNQYHLDLFYVGTRSCLDRGELSIYVANVQNRWGILKLTVRALLGGLEQARDFESYCLSSCEIESRRHRLQVAVDGEVVRLHSPFHYRVRAGALRVCVPEHPARQPTTTPMSEK